MKIDFESHKLEDAANGEDDGTYSKMKQIIKQRLGKQTACTYNDIVSALDSLAAADSCAGLPRSLHPHPLQGDLKGCFAVDIKIKGQGGRGVCRLIFRPNREADDPELRIDNYKTIKNITIVELCVDYH